MSNTNMIPPIKILEKRLNSLRNQLKDADLELRIAEGRKRSILEEILRVRREITKIERTPFIKKVFR